MKTKMVVLSLITSAIMNVSPSFARTYKKFTPRKVSTALDEGKGLEFFPVKFNKGKTREGVSFENKSLKLITEKPLVSVNDFKLGTLGSSELGLRFDVTERDTDILGKMSKKYSGALLGVFYDGSPVAVVKMKGKKSDSGILFQFDDAAKFERVVAKLADS